MAIYNGIHQGHEVSPALEPHSSSGPCFGAMFAAR